MKRALAFVLLLSISGMAAADAPSVFVVWTVTHLAIMAHDVVTTGVKLPTCSQQQQENASAYALSHGGWGNGNVNGPNLKTCTEGSAPANSGD
jgi:hypothetical protein